MFDDITFLVRYGPQIRINFGGRSYVVETPIIPTAATIAGLKRIGLWPFLEPHVGEPEQADR